MCALARWQIGGQTGDVLGATAVVTECAVLTALC
ncbi:adenosylcobinamide-GDP ribazoletransferase [Komagataeibacter kakiaceti]|nr:adenosylcobinamide-GDP ribazoletransferase [Komagataeibacter kakiaceti]